MRFDHFKQIAERIAQDIPCPRCGERFDIHYIEVCGFQDKNIDFHVPCTHCGAKVSVNANIQSVPPITKKIFEQRQHQRITKKAIILSPDKVRKISNFLKDFHGNDVRDLFQ